MDVTVPCPCVGTPHPDGDTVTLRDKPTLHMGTTAFSWTNIQVRSKAPTEGEIAELYLTDGISDWTFLLEDGERRPLNDENLRWFLDDFELSYPVANAAADLYTEAIYRPLLASVKKVSKPTKGARRSSNSTPTSPST